MTFMDEEANTPAVDPQAAAPVEDYSDFTNPANLLRTRTWLTAAPEARPALVDRAMNSFLKDLEAKKDKTIETVDAYGKLDTTPVWSKAGTLTG